MELKIRHERRCILHVFIKKTVPYLPAPLVIIGVVRVSRSEICEDSLVLAAVCCCTLTSAASAKCISVFLSGLSSKFLQPMHLQMDEHMIFAFKVKWQRRTNVNRSLLEKGGKKMTLKQLLKSHLIALAVVLKAAWPFAVAAFTVSAVWLTLFTFTDFRLEGFWVSVQACLWNYKFSPLFIHLTGSDWVQ